MKAIANDPKFIELIRNRISENKFSSNDVIALLGKPDKKVTHLDKSIHEALIINLSSQEVKLKGYDGKMLIILSYNCGKVSGCSESIHFVFHKEEPSRILAAIKWVACPE